MLSDKVLQSILPLNVGSFIHMRMLLLLASGGDSLFLNYSLFLKL